MIRSGLEVTRAFPVSGLVTGGISDFVNGIQDMRSVASVAPPELLVFMAGRHSIAIFNSAFGHVIYCVELVQDLATASVVGSEIDAVTVPLNGLLLSGKIAVDGFQTGLDLLLQARRSTAGTSCPATTPPRPPGRAWSTTTRRTSSATSPARCSTPTTSAPSAGNAQVVKTAATTAKEVLKACGFLKTAALTVLQGWWNVWGGSVVGVNHSLSRAAAGR